MLIRLQKYDAYAEAKTALENGNAVAWANDNTEVIAFAIENEGFTVGIPSLGSADTIAPAVTKGCGVLGLGLLGGAYMAETFRSGLDSVDKIQEESALSLGMNPIQTFRYVILPQAISTSVPGLVANIIFWLKETSVFSAISLMDLMFTAKDLIGLYYKTTECLFLLVVFYLIMLLPVSILGTVVERRVRYAGFGD